MTQPNSTPSSNTRDIDHRTADGAAPYAPERSFCRFDSFEYRPEESRYRASYDRGVIPASTAVISAMAVASDTDPLDIEPLYSTIDPDALDALVASGGSNEGNTGLTFDHHGFEVMVSVDGSITLTLSESGATSAIE